MKTPKATPKIDVMIVKNTTPESTGTPMSQVSDLSDFNSPDPTTLEDVVGKNRRESRRNTASSTDIATLMDDLEAEDTEEMEDDEEEDLDSSLGEASPKMCPASIKKSKKKKKRQRRRRSSRRHTASPGNVAALIDALQDSDEDSDDDDDDIATPKVPKHRSQTPLKSILSVKSKPTNSLLDMFSGTWCDFTFSCFYHVTQII